MFDSARHKIGAKRLRYLLMLVALTLLLYILYSLFFANNHKKVVTPPALVTVSTVRKGDIPLYESTIGTVTPLGSVTVKTQINGRLTHVYFTEGKIVKKGELLAQIDPQPYEAQLLQYQGQLIRDQALLDNARLDLIRYEKLIKEDSISKQIYDTQKSLVVQYEGAVKTDVGLIQSAKVNIQYCRIVSDIDGMIGLRLVNPGNFVQTTDTTPITTINTISPITVIFPISEDRLPLVHAQFMKTDSLPVDAFDKRGETLLASGALAAIDSQISTTTGTINLRASFTNEDMKLFPNQFVNVRLKVDTLKDSLIIPNAAIQMGSKGGYVYVVNNEDKSVTSKQVIVKTTVGLDAAVTGELAEGQTIVVQGQDKLKDGAIITTTTTQVTPPSGGPK